LSLAKIGTSGREDVQLFKGDRWLLIGPSPTELGAFIHIFCKDEKLVYVFAQDLGIETNW